MEVSDMPMFRISGQLKSILSIAGLAIFLSGAVDATPESRAAANFLLFSPSARSAGMGDAFVAIADDADATFFNPAALANDEGRSLSTTFYKPVPSLASDIFTSFGAYTQPMGGVGNFGLSLIYTSLGKQFRTDEQGQDLGTFTSFGVAFGVSYGAYITKSLSLGLTTKLIHQNLAGQGAGAEQGSGTGTSFGGDLGLLWKPSDRFSFGWALRNVGPNMTFIDADQSDPLPQTFTIGFGWTMFKKEKQSFLLVTDVYKPLSDEGFGSFISGWSDGAPSEELKDMDYHVGGEWAYGLSEISSFAVRAGYSHDQDGNRKTPTFGFGLKYDWATFDLSYFANSGSAVRNVFRFSGGFTF
jgi:hypothetical protein